MKLSNVLDSAMVMDMKVPANLIIELVWVFTDDSGAKEPTRSQDMSQELGSPNTVNQGGKYHVQTAVAGPPAANGTA